MITTVQITNVDFLPKEETKSPDEQIKKSTGLESPSSLTQTNESRKFLENISFKISEEKKYLNTMLNRLDTFQKTISRSNRNLESLRKNINIINIPISVKSERPRALEKPPQPRASIKKDNKQDVITIEDCKMWIKNKTINPKTGRKIDENGPTYKRFQTMSKIYKLI